MNIDERCKYLRIQPRNYAAAQARRARQALLDEMERVTGRVLHPWLQQELRAVPAELPVPEGITEPSSERLVWECWQEGLMVHFRLPALSSSSSGQDPEVSAGGLLEDL
jgi:hypothetical protein